MLERVLRGLGSNLKNVCPIRLFKPLLPMARSAVDNRGRPWTAGTTLRVAPDRPPAQPGCPPLHYLGARPQTPRFAALRGLFEISPKPENRQGWASGMDNRKRLPTPPPAHPCRNPPAGWPRQQGPGARRRTRGAQPRGPGACRPTPRSALGAGRRPGGLSLFGPLGEPDIGIPARARPALIADKHSRSLCL